MTQELIVLCVITTLRITDRGYLIRLLTAAARNFGLLRESDKTALVH